MEQATHPCDRGEILHIIQQKRQELEALLKG